MPKLPRGTGNPPFRSNLAILSRRLPLGETVGSGLRLDGCGEVLRCWSAAIRSFRLAGVGTFDVLEAVLNNVDRT